MYKPLVEIRIILMFSIMLFSCSQDSRLIDVLKKIEISIKNEIIKKDIKDLSKDSLVNILPVFRVEYYRLLKKLDNEDEINDLIKPNLIRPLFASNEEILLFAFQRHLNRENIDLKQIQIDIQQTRIARKEEMKRDEKFHKKKLMSLTSSNNSKWHIGDTLSVFLEISNDNGVSLIYYKNYPASLDYSDVEDTLKLKGVLIDKFYSKNHLNNNSPKSENLNALNFKLKILELNRPNVSYNTKKLGLGDYFDLHLAVYGRPIE